LPIIDKICPNNGTNTDASTYGIEERCPASAFVNP